MGRVAKKRWALKQAKGGVSLDRQGEGNDMARVTGRSSAVVRGGSISGHGKARNPAYRGGMGGEIATRDGIEGDGGGGHGRWFTVPLHLHPWGARNGVNVGPWLLLTGNGDKSALVFLHLVLSHRL